MASTADEVEIVQWLRVWTATLDPGTVDLTAPWACTVPAGSVAVRFDSGRGVVIDCRSTHAVHPHSGEPPPPLGRCHWVRSCEHEAVRMQPHPLMTPVPVCADCIRAFHLT